MDFGGGEGEGRDVRWDVGGEEGELPWIVTAHVASAAE